MYDFVTLFFWASSPFSINYSKKKPFPKKIFTEMQCNYKKDSENFDRKIIIIKKRLAYIKITLLLRRLKRKIIKKKLTCKRQLFIFFHEKNYQPSNPLYIIHVHNFSQHDSTTICFIFGNHPRVLRFITKAFITKLSFV